jgi:hypothetical protein
MRDIIDGVGEQSAGYLHVRLATGERDEVHIAHAGLEAEDLLPVAAREHTHLPSEGSFAPSEPIRANQSQSEPIRANQSQSEVVHLPSDRQSEVIRGHQSQSEVVHLPSEAIRGHQCPSERLSEAIRGHQRPSEAIRGHQRPSEGNQRLGSVRTEPSAAPTSSAFPSGAQCTHETCPLGWGTTYAHWPASVSHAFS